MPTDVPARPPLRERPLTTVALLVGCLLMALVARLANVSGVYVIDDFNYLRHAAEVADGRFHLSQVLYWHGMRPVIFVPIAVLFRLFGVSEATALAWPLIASLSTVALVYGIAATLYSRAAGLAAAAVAALLPVLVVESTRVLPGSIMNVVLATSAFAFVRSEVSPTRRTLWMATSGATFALMPWTGHLGLVFGVFFPIAVLLFRRHPVLSYWPLAGGAAAVVAFVTLYQAVSTGNPMANVDVAQKVLMTEDSPPKPLFYLWLLAKPDASHGGLLYFAAIGGLAALLRRHRGALLVLAWFVCTYLVIEFGSSSATEYRPLFKQVRYVTVIAVPGAILAGVGLAELNRLLGRVLRNGTLAAALTIAVLAAVGVGAVRTMASVREWGLEQREDIREIRDVVREHEGRPIYVMHWLWNTRVGYFLRYTSGYEPSGYDPYHAVRLDRVDRSSLNRYVQSLEPGEPMPAGLLIVDELLLDMSLRSERVIGLVGPGEIPPWLARPPAGWRLLRRIGSVALYELPDGEWPGPDGPDGAGVRSTRSSESAPGDTERPSPE